jgi:hypothetical protein
MGDTTDLELAGTGLKAGGQIAAGDTRDALERANASIADQQAKSELNAGNYNANLMRRKAAMIQGTQIASTGANNLQQRGTPAAVISSTAQTQELNVLTTLNNSMRKAWGFEVQGASDTFQGEQAKTGGILSGIGSLASGGASAYNTYNKNNPVDDEDD